jgi:hypothetical protein
MLCTEGGVAGFGIPDLGFGREQTDHENAKERKHETRSTNLGFGIARDG